MLKEYLKQNTLIADGAMGTYYANRTQDNKTISEWANLTHPEIIRSIHREYIQAGAKLIRTNTFSANSITLAIDQPKLASLITAACDIAKSAADDEVFIGAGIGPIPQLLDANGEPLEPTVVDQYMFIVDTFLQQGINIFIFETLSSLDHLKVVFDYIKQVNPDAYILTQFAMALEGSTRKGLSMASLVTDIRTSRTIDAYGFNCGVGPTHLLKLIDQLNITTDTISALPNAGYPQIVNERTVYHENADYFADVMIDLVKRGVKILGGCCGTTPQYIKALSTKLESVHPQRTRSKQHKPLKAKSSTIRLNTFQQKLVSGQFPIAVELDPPLNGQVKSILRAAKQLHAAGVDVITIADSPLARARMDSLMLAAKIQREIGIQTMPHICCRDRNIIGTKSSLLGAHMEEIRNLLAVTGDPIPSSDRSEIKSVFNLNSQGLMELVASLNAQNFSHEPFYLGGALNLNAHNIANEVARMERKSNAGAQFFLTQPIFEQRVISYLETHPFGNKYVLGGIMPLVSLNNALFLNNEVPGISIPPEYIDRFHQDMDKKQAQQVGVTIALALAKKIRNYVDGFYFITPFNKVELIIEILRRLKEGEERQQ